MASPEVPASTPISGHGISDAATLCCRHRHRVMGLAVYHLASRSGMAASPRWLRACGRGFTLAEILVVLMVIGLAAGLAYAQFERDPRHVVEREGRRLAAALEHAALLAQWKNKTLGVSAVAGSYRFWQRGDDAQWTALSDDEVLAPHNLPVSVVAGSVLYAGQPMPADAILPLRPSGRNEPYRIEIRSPEWRVLLSADPLNRVALIGPLAH